MVRLWKLALGVHWEMFRKVNVRRMGGVIGVVMEMKIILKVVF